MTVPDHDRSNEHADDATDDTGGEIAVDADALGGSAATGGYGDESTGMSEQATSEEASTEQDGTETVSNDGPDLADETPLLDRSPGEDAVDYRGGNADR